MPLRITWMLCALACCAVSCSAPSSDDSGSGELEDNFVSSYEGPKILLKAKFSPGEYTLTEALDMNMRITAEGDTVPIEMAMELSGGVVITEPDARGDQKMRFTCESIAMTNVTGSVKQHFDSRGGGGQSEDLARLLRPMIGWGATLTVDANGKFKRIEGIELLMERISSSGVPSQQSRALRKQMQTFLNEMLTKHWGKLLPTEPVGPGDTWEGKINVGSVPALGELGVKANCRLRDIRETPGGKIAEVAFKMVMSIRDKPLDMSALGGGGGAEARIGSMVFQGNGTFEFDTSIGLSTLVKMRMTCDGDMAIRPPGEE